MADEMNFSAEDMLDYNSWENIEDDLLAQELGGLNTRCNELAIAIRDLITSNDYTKAVELRDRLMQSDLSAAGWIRQFRLTNSEAFSKFMNGPGRPTFYGSLTAPQKQQYEKMLGYYKDAFYLENACTALNKLFLELPLQDGFKLLALVRNFEKGGFDYKIYQEIAWDVKAVSAMMAMSSSDFERKAERARSYLANNRTRLSPSDLARGYRQERLKDYQACVKDTLETSNFIESSGGRYTVKSSVLAKMAVIDNYTYELSLMKDLNEQMEKKNDECMKLLNQEIANALKSCTTERCKGVAAAFANIVEAVKEFSSECTETIRDFHEESSKTPYCFMIQPAYFDRIVQNYSFRPEVRDAWDKGTNYRDIYQMAARGLSDQCDFFVNKNGEIS